MLEIFSSYHWQETYAPHVLDHAQAKLEHGHILYFPHLGFILNDAEKYLLSPAHADPKAKNIGFQMQQNRLWGVRGLNDAEHQQLKAMLARYAQHALSLLENLLPSYMPYLIIGRTSFRPVEITDRKTSYRKDDKRLHVDAFPSAPNQGKRILRVFTNVNPQQDRVWRLGESFFDVAQRFLPTVPCPLPGTRHLLRFFRITKSLRTLYDHYMLHIHDNMKADETYQQQAKQQSVAFPPNSTWVVQTDHVSHAAMRGQYVLEQTFYLPINAMRNPQQSPLKILETMMGQKLV